MLVLAAFPEIPLQNNALCPNRVRTVSEWRERLNLWCRVRHGVFLQPSPKP